MRRQLLPWGPRAWPLTRRAGTAPASFDLALALYSDLTSQDVARSRSVLEFYRRGSAPPEQAHGDVLDHYFALLWQFEKIYAGREALDRQRLLNGSSPAVRYLDEMIAWHVTERAARWLDLHSLQRPGGEQAERDGGGHFYIGR